MKKEHYRRAKGARKPAWGMEIDEVSLNRYWTVKVSTPYPKTVGVTFYLHGMINAELLLLQGELEDASEGFRALANVLDEAREVERKGHHE